MICVSIGRSRVKNMIADFHLMVEQGAKLVELRIDYLEGNVDLQALLDRRPGPVIVTCRRESDGGRFKHGEEKRLVLLRTAIALGADYVDLEDDVAALIPRYGSTKRIVSLHDFRRTPANLKEIYARLAALDADVVKIASMAHSPHDNVRMLEMIRDAALPTVGLCMGEIGTPSRVLARRYGAPFTFATFSNERQMAPGQMTFRDMEDVYRYSQISPKTEVFGVIGDPIQHSLSPLIHNAAFKALGLDKVYVPFRVPRGEVPGLFEDAEVLGLKGLSVTIPHKESVLPHLTQVDPYVSGGGACNTVVFGRTEAGEREVRGYNTDLDAALDSLEDEIRIAGQEGSPLAGKTALVLGAGGAAKAIAFGLKARGAEVLIANRTLEKAQALAEKLDCKAVPWDERGVQRFTVLINCTPIGMHPNVDESPFERQLLRPSMVVFDTVYNPETTLLLKHARMQHCKVVTGLEMFVRQAALQFKLFTGQDAPIDLMRDVVRQAIAPVRVTPTPIGSDSGDRIDVDRGELSESSDAGDGG